MAKNKKRSSLFGKPRKVESIKSFSSEERQYAESYEPDVRLKRIIQLVILVVAATMAFIAYSNRKEIRENEAAELAKEQTAKLNQLGPESFQAFELARTKANTAFESKDYFEAVFQYRQALGHDPSNKIIYKKMIKALDNSCAQGVRMHCLSVEKERARLKALE